MLEDLLKKLHGYSSSRNSLDFVNLWGNSHAQVMNLTRFYLHFTV